MAGPLAWALPFVLIGLPAFLMGGTFPTFLRAIAPEDETVGRASGFLYAANTCGAIVGTLAVPFYLVPALGVSGTALVAASCNLLVTVVALAASRLYIQGVSNSGDSITSLRYMRLQALLPLLIHNREPRSALVIGLGTGITAGALLTYPDLEQRVCVEPLPAVVRAAPQF